MAVPPPAEVPKDKILFPPAEQKVYSEQELKARREELWAKRPELKPESNTKIFWRSAGMGLAETVAPVIKEARDIPADDPFLQLSSKEQNKALARELNIFDKSSAIRKVSKEVVQFVFGLPIEFGLDVYESSKLLAGKPGLPKEGVNIPGFGNVLPRSRKVTEQQKTSKDFMEYIAPGADQTVKDLATVLQPVITEDLFRVLTTAGAGVRAGRQLGKVTNYKHVGTFTVPSKTVAENKSLAPLFKGKDPLRLAEKKGVYKEPSTKAEEFLFGKQKIKEIEMPIVDVNGKTGLVGLKATNKGIQVKIYTPRNLKGEAPEVPLFEKVFNKGAEPTAPQTMPQLAKTVTQPGQAPQPTQMPAVPVKAPGIPKTEVPPVAQTVPSVVKERVTDETPLTYKYIEGTENITVGEAKQRLEELKSSLEGLSEEGIEEQMIAEDEIKAIQTALNKLKVENPAEKKLGDLAGKKLTVEPGALKDILVTTPDGTPVTADGKPIKDNTKVKIIEKGIKEANEKDITGFWYGQYGGSAKDTYYIQAMYKDPNTPPDYPGRIGITIGEVKDMKTAEARVAQLEKDLANRKTWEAPPKVKAIIDKAVKNVETAKPAETEPVSEDTIKTEVPATSQGELKVNEVIKTIDDTKVKQQTPKFIFKETDKLIFSEYNGAQVLSNKYILDIVDSKDEFYNSVRELFKQGESYNEEQIDPETLKPLIESALKDTEKVESIIGYSKANNSQSVVLKTASHEVLVDPKYLNYFNKRYKDVEYFANDKHKPIAVKIGDKLVGLIMPKQFDDKYVKLSQAPAKSQATEILDEYRKSILPEYNTHKDMVAIDAFVDKIRKLNPKDKWDEMWTRNGFKYIATVSYPHSLGERGNVTETFYKEKPTVADIVKDIREEYKETKERINEEMAPGVVAKSARDENIEAKIDQALEKTKPTQKEQVKKAIAEKPKTIKEVSEETEILEPNVRRILGVGAKEGTFERVDKGVYRLKTKDGDVAIIHAGDALEVLPKLAKDGFKADMVFLDIPYNAAGNRGGNRMNTEKNTLYKTISPDQFEKFLVSVTGVLKEKNSPLIYMHSQSESSKKQMQVYTDKILEAGFIPLAKGDYYKMTKEGKRFTKPMRPEPLAPEGIIIFNRTGEFNFNKLNGEEINLQYKLVRPKGWQTEKPAELLESLIKLTTNEGEVVLDPFMGSGVSIAEAVKTGRKGVGIEISEEAITKHAIPKIENASPKEVKPTAKETAIRELKEIAKGKTEEQFHEAINKTEKDFEDIIQYHGTQKGEALYDALKNGTVKASESGLMGKGFYLTTTQEAADYFGHQVIDGNARKMVKEKPTIIAFDLTDLKIKRLDYGKGEYYDFLEKEKLGIEEYNNKLKAEGYDGLNLVGRGETVIFYPEKLKQFATNDYIKEKPAIPKSAIPTLEVIGKEKAITKQDVEEMLQAIINPGKNREAIEKIHRVVTPDYGKIYVDLSKNKPLFAKVLNERGENYKSFGSIKKYPVDNNIADGYIEKAQQSIKDNTYEIKESKTGFRVNFFEKADIGVKDNGYFTDIKLDKNIDNIRKIGDKKVAIPSKASDLFFDRTKVKTLLQNNKEFMDNPVLEVVEDFNLVKDGMKVAKGDDKILYLQFTGKTSQFKIKPESLGLVTDNLKIGEKIKVDTESFMTAKGEEIRVTVPKAGGGKGFLASKQGASINEIITRGTHKPDEKVIADFKISDEVIKIIRRFGSDVGEKHLSRKYAGIYKNLPDKVRVQALYDVTVATHEATHAIDKKTGLITDLIITTPRGNKVRKLLTNIYKEYYPGARRDHKLDLRMREGLATLIEKYFFNPAEIQTKYPELVNLFINPNGEYYKPEIGELLESMNTLVENYAKMTPEQRIGSRIRRGDEVVKRNEGFTIAQRANYEIFDRYEPISRISREAGVSETEKDPYLTLAVWDAKQTQINNWYKGKGAVVYVGNGRFELRKGLTVQSYFEKIKGKEKEFSSYLVARRVVSEYNKLQRLKENFYAFPLTSKLITELTNASLQLREKFLIEAGFTEPPLGIKADKELLESLNEILELNSVLEKDDFSIQDAGAVVSQYQSQFKEAEKIYDDINKTLLEYLYHAGRISGKQYNTWVSENGYSSFRRFVYDEMIGDGLKKARTVKATPGMLKGRTGSKLDIVDPVYSQVVAIQEGITLSIQNMFWHKMAKLSLSNMEVARRFEHLETEMSYNPKNGKVTYPQMSDPNIIPVYSNGKISFFKASPDLIEVAKQLQPKQIDDFSRLLRMFSGIFVRFTTSANPFFVIPNFAVDQFSLAQNTKTNAVPLIDPAKRSVIPAIKEGLSRTALGKNIKTDEQFEMYSVIGGFRQTLANFLRTAPEDMATTFLGRQTKIGKAIDYIDSGISILELPSNLSEVMSRYAEYDRAIKAGASHAKALYMAQEATTPFNRYGNLGGQVGETWLKSIPYANASFQVTHKYFRAWKDNPKRVGTLMAGLVLSIMATTIALMKSTNEKQKRTLAQMPVDLLARGFYVPIPGTDRFARIRIPEQFGTISAIAQLYIISNYTGQKVAMDEWLDASTAWIPQQMDISEPSKWLFSLLPQAIKPEIEVAANVKTFPNLSTIEPEWYKNQPAEKRVFANTTKIAKLIGELTGWSPIKIDFYLREKFGTIVGVAQKFSTADVKSEYIIEKLGIAGEYYFGSGRLFDHFKQQQARIDLQYNTIKANPDTYSHEEKIEVVTTRKRYNKIAEAFSIIREYEREKKEIPEDVKEAVFEILIALDTDDTEKVKDIFTDKLYLKVLELKGEIENK